MRDGAGVGEFLTRLAGEVDPQRGANAVLIQRDADQAFLGPEAKGVADEAEDIRWCFDGELFHDPCFLHPGLSVFCGCWWWASFW